MPKEDASHKPCCPKCSTELRKTLATRNGGWKEVWQCPKCSQEVLRPSENTTQLLRDDYYRW